MCCVRKGCDNIMCDINIAEIGYICNECRKEFNDYLRYNFIYPRDEIEIKEHIKIFLFTYKDKDSEGDDRVDEFFNRYKSDNI